MIIILAIYIINTTLSSLFFKKNRLSSLDTLLTIAFFGLAINSVVFGFSVGFVDDVWAGTSLVMGAVSIIRGGLIVAGLFFVAKAFKLLPVSIMSPLSMVIIVPLLLLSWWIFGDAVDTIVLILVGAMLMFCIALVTIEGKKNSKKKKEIVADKILSPNTIDTNTKKPKIKNYWLGIIYFAIALSCFLTTQILTRILADSGQSMFTITFLNSIVIFAVVLIVFAVLRKNPVKTLVQNCKSPAQFGIAITDSLWLFLYLPLVVAMNLGVLNAASRISTALVVLAGIFFFKEKPSKLSYPIIVVIIAIGIALAFLSS